MIRDMLRLAVAVFSELDASAETEEVLTPSLSGKREEQSSNRNETQRRSGRLNRVRNWGEREEIDWLFIERAEVPA